MKLYKGCLPNAISLNWAHNALEQYGGTNSMIMRGLKIETEKTCTDVVNFINDSLIM